MSHLALLSEILFKLEMMQMEAAMQMEAEIHVPADFTI